MRERELRKQASALLLNPPVIDQGEEEHTSSAEQIVSLAEGGWFQNKVNFICHPLSPILVHKMANEESFEHDKGPPIVEPLTVEYCPECGLPFDFCEYGENWEKCKTTTLERFPQFYAHIVPGTGTDGAGDESEKKKKPAAKDLQKKEEKKVSIQIVSRNKRKAVTVVTGLEHFGVKLDKATKVFSKQFNCGSSVKSSPGQPDGIEIQGDVENQVLGLLVSHFEVPKEKIECLKPK